ncbi:MAG: hypothetical protein FWG40_01665 [Peptococcaceae bacterium]|nr:hypothetical protein [Peptococcaceae bacterium]
MSKVLVEITLPAAERVFDAYIPLESKMSEVIKLLSGMLTDLAESKYTSTGSDILCDAATGTIYDVDKIVAELGIKNGSRLLLI